MSAATEMPESTPSRFPQGLLTIDLPAGATIIRVHRHTNGAVYFGPSAGKPAECRFDALHSEYRILYAAVNLEGAFVETVLRRPRRIFRRAFVEERGWTTLAVKRTLKLAKLYDEGLQFHGTDAGLIGAEDYTESRALALSIHQEDISIDGLAYRSRYDNGEICHALFDRVAGADLAVATAERFDQHKDRVDNLMRRYGAVFDTSASIPPAD